VNVGNGTEGGQMSLEDLMLTCAGTVRRICYKIQWDFNLIGDTNFSANQNTFLKESSFTILRYAYEYRNVFVFGLAKLRNTI